MRIAVEGCCHDELEVIYDTIEHIEKRKGTKIDLLLVCGDFQATRNPDDLLCMAVPPKFRNMKYFYKYYKGEKKAPFLTLIIGGNHEASNHMQELPYGGWVAPNIYYMGYAGIVNVGGVRIGGMSGIFKGKDYHKGHFEKPPYDNDSLRSCYHTRSLEVFRLKQVQHPVDIMMSHDWPLHAVHAGNVEQLLRWKPDFRDEIQQDSLGSAPAQEVLTHIKPDYWFSAHLHCKYPAVIKHKVKEGEEQKITKFLSLDKCLPKRSFLQIFEIPTQKEPPYKLELDPEWLVILKNTNHLLNITNAVRYMPGVGCKERYDFRVTQEEIDNLVEDFGGDLTLPENFKMTVTPYDGTSDIRRGKMPPCQVNPQTTLLCQMLGITDPFAVFCGKSAEENPEEICLDVESEQSDSASATQDDNSEPEDGADESQDGTADGSAAGNSTLNTTSGEGFPTFLHSMSVNESVLNDSSVTESELSQPTASRKLSEMDTSTAPPTEDVEDPPSIQDAPPTEQIIPPEVQKVVITPLSLPKPKDSAIGDLTEVVAAPESRKRQSTDDSHVSSSEPQSSEVKPTEGSTGVKKFKRRNVAMYNILTNQGVGEDTSEST